jgi:HEAT repeat protein
MTPPSSDQSLDDTNSRLNAVLAGYRGDHELVQQSLLSQDPLVRIAGLGALSRLGLLDAKQLGIFANDADYRVRRRVAELAASWPTFDLSPLLGDDHESVVEMAAWACGEHEIVSDVILERLIHLTLHGDDPLIREAAVAALGAIGDQRGLPAILQACTDKPAIRRRAVLALAPFAGAEVDSAIESALQDRDWQVRQAAEDIRA